MNLIRIRKFLMDWILAPYAIRVVCFVLSKCIRRDTTIYHCRKTTSRLYILGNGPSLRKDLVKYENDIRMSDCIVVNFMGLTSEYEKVRPTYYVLTDPLFFTPFSELPLNKRDDILRLQQILINKTSWSMTVVTHGRHDTAPLVAALKVNKNITVVYSFIGVPVPTNITDFSGWFNNRYAPPGQTVLNTAIYLGIVWRYAEIVLLGADTSFHAMVGVEQDTNRLYSLDEHFYGIKKLYLYKDLEHKKSETMSGFLKSVYEAFAWYDKLREFADWAGVRIINASSFSWIDSFERPSDNDISTNK